MIEFEIVGDERRRAPRRKISPFLSAIRAGKTVFVLGARPNAFNGYYGHLKSQGYRLRTAYEHGPDGVLIWAEPIEPAP